MRRLTMKSKKDFLCPACGKPGHSWTDVYYTEGAMLKPAKGIYFTKCKALLKYCILACEKEVVCGTLHV